MNQTLAAQPALQQRLKPFAGKTLRLALPAWSGRLIVNGDGLFAQSQSEAFDATIRMPLDALMQWPIDRIAARKRIEIEGDADFALAVAETLTQIDIDPEEVLAGLIGDIPAHRLTQEWRNGRARLGDRWQRLAESLADYARFEGRLIAAKPELDRFNQSIDALRDDAARLEQRIQRLEEGTR